MSTYEQEASRLQIRLLIIGLAFAAAVGLYVLLAFILEHTQRPPAVPSALAALRPVLIGLSVVMAVAALVAEQLQLNRERVKARAETQPQPIASVAAQCQTTFILCAALTEAIAIYGLLLFFLGDPFVHLLWFAGAAVALQAGMLLPRASQYPALVRELGPELELLQQTK